MTISHQDMHKRLGRLHIPDERDANYPLPMQSSSRTFRSWLAPGVLDQGNKPHCVAYSGIKLLTALPHFNRPVDPLALYNECQKRDEWPGENYDGTSVRALMKVFQNWGFVSEYRWTRDVPVLINHVLEKGPIVVGTSWTVDMFTPDKHGYIYPTGQSVGGHAYLIPCVNLNRKNPNGSVGAARILNSWSENWGQKGRAWITLDDLGRLLADRGEACAPVEVHHNNVKS